MMEIKNEKDNLIISYNIKRERKNAKLTQEDMANKLNVTSITYKRIENNPTSRDLDDLYSIAEIIGCHISKFFLGTNVTKSN